MKYEKFICGACGAGYRDEEAAGECYRECMGTRPPTDVVERPSHYNQGGIECIEAIQASMSHEEFKGYLKGSVLKYLWRYQHKGKPVEDLRKANWFLDRLRAVVAETE